MMRRRHKVFCEIWRVVHDPSFPLKLPFMDHYGLLIWKEIQIQYFLCTTHTKQVDTASLPLCSHTYLWNIISTLFLGLFTQSFCNGPKNLKKSTIFHTLSYIRCRIKIQHSYITYYFKPNHKTLNYDLPHTTPILIPHIS